MNINFIFLLRKGTLLSFYGTQNEIVSFKTLKATLNFPYEPFPFVNLIEIII